ncbi:MAG: ABC transporter substrate-binding protein [Gemmatimonadetes bacterium]|nr:ABC transporter substrate-binding protein [Gemmatimonadota bacterium]
MTGETVGRREFLRSAVHGCAALLALPRAPEALRVALVTSAGAGAASGGRGVTLGVEEAARTGALFGQRIELRTVAAGAAERLVRAERPTALIGGWDPASARALGALADAAGVLFLNAGSPADALRGAECRRNVFHVEASDAMYRDALAGDAGGATRAVLWHPALERFGAAQLNDRFRARFHTAMDGPAWAGWMAVKLLWEASLRARTTDPAGVRAWLEREGTQLDGHKGWPLSFRAWDHQLRQPLYRVAPAAGGGTRLVGEVPTRAPDAAGSSRELLDRLGAGPSTSTCRRIHGGKP